MRTERSSDVARAGTHFLKLARMLFSEPTVTRVFTPAIADFREELRGAHGLRRFLVSCRWYWSLSILAIVVPHVIPAGAERQLLATMRTRSTGWFLVVLGIALYAATWQMFGGFALASAVVGTALAYALRKWHTRHPPLAIDRRALRWDGRESDINLSSIHVAGDIAGLLFVVGSVTIVLIGLPGMWWFFAAGLVGAVVAAWCRFAWIRKSVPEAPLSISSRA
jgi:hypothetical protein